MNLSVAFKGVKVPEIFEQKYNDALIHQVVVSCLANMKQGSKKQKNRSEASGGGRKPWRQKGTGRARAGTIRSPLWRGGGVTFAARTDQNRSHRVNRKMYKGAMRSLLSELHRQQRLFLFEPPALEEPKTKLLIMAFKNWEIDLSDNQKLLLIIDSSDQNLDLASRNLHQINILAVQAVTPVNLVAADQILISQEAILKLEKMLT